MTRIGIMTFLHNENCGSSLQAFALQRTLQSLGYEPLGLDYRPDRAEQVRNLLRSGNSPAVVLDSLRRRRGHGDRNTAGFDRFNRDRLSLSQPARNRADLRRLSEDCDALLAGSDQVWSPEWLNPAYFFDFAPDKPKAAYACSLGVSAEPSPRKARKMGRLCDRFTAVSVREEEGKAILQKILPDKEISVMPDPVFLLTREEWTELAGKPANAGTCAAYFIKEDPDYPGKARAIAGEKGLRLLPLAVTASMQALPDAVRNPDPPEWLHRMAAAEHVVTDSFHGAAMAAILGKPLTILRRWKDGDPQSKNSRVDQLKRLLGWTDDQACLPGAEVDERLHALRDQGRMWLAASLQQCLEIGGQG